MLVYAPQPAPRLKYILDFIGKELFDKPIQFTDNKQDFLNYDDGKINYSQHKISDNEFWIVHNNLLFQDGVTKQVVESFDYNSNRAFFPVKKCDYPFDLFAACFYLLSRYEEYLPHVKDKYGRYAHTNSLAFKESFLHLPLVNIWLEDFKKALQQKFPTLEFRGHSFSFTPTYDIDIAWSYLNKGWWRNAGGFLKSLLKLEWPTAVERLKVLSGKKQDPFDSYRWLHNLHQAMQLKPVYFFLIAAKQKGFDKNISPSCVGLQQLIKEHNSLYAVGIHPSWQSGDDEGILRAEVMMLKGLVDKTIINSRQHYLRFYLPTTYRKLISLGIKNEYSMGYGTVNGFRASVASSFYWYDLDTEMATDLLVHPFCFMDANAYYELKLSPAAALVELTALYKTIKAVDGSMITLWHNNFLGTDRNFEGWREAYDHFLKMIATEV